MTASLVRTLTRSGDRAGGVARARTVAMTIVDDVRRRGDAALFEMADRFDGVRLDSLEVPRAAITRALDLLDRNLRRAMERSAANIARVHAAFRPRGDEIEVEPGIIVGRRCDPLARVGVYAPGGRAAYPSSVLMGAIPARVAGVGEIVLTSPPSGGTALPSPTVLAAAALANVDRVFAVGGAGAVAAMAFGTATIPRVDRIIGPGNGYVAAAKLGVVAEVAIDCPAGPSELLVIADGSADPADVAAELIGQAEHDPLAYVAALVVGDDVVAAIERELELLAARAERGNIVRQALRTSDGVVAVTDLETAVAMANEFAPEHLLLATDRAEWLLPRVRNAGTVFVGTSASVAMGDYMTGANHVLPTGGLARCYSGLSPLDFVRWTTYQRMTPTAASALAADVALLADAEGLPAHADAARRRSLVS
jgi:histidinol dehydrogenase